MRDVALAAFIFGAIPFILRRPWLGVLMYVWLSVMNPHRLTWGFSYNFSFAATIAVVTLAALPFSRDVKAPPFNALSVTLILFVIWTTVTTLFAFYPSDAFERWTTLMKTELMALLIPMLFHRRDQLRALLWVIVLSIAFYGVKGGIWILATGGGQRVWGPPGSFIEDNNSIAVALVMTIPLMRYLQLTAIHRWIRWGLTAMMLACGVAVLGTYSRGALLAVGVMVAFLWWKSRQKVGLLLVALLAIPPALSFMPEQWYSRMDTIVDYQQESSAQMRFNSWGTMFNIAKARPLVGGGFEVATKEIYERFAPDPTFPPQVAHSIFFQMMGEHGFVGLAIYLVLLVSIWVQAAALYRESAKLPSLAWARDLGLMLQVSFIGFVVGGAFLSLVSFDVPYYLIGVLLAARAMVVRESGAGIATRAATAAPGAPTLITPVERAAKSGND